MKLKSIIALAIAALFAAGCATEKHEDQADQARLQAQAKVAKEDAMRTALAQVPNGTVKAAELEKEHGKLIWSFDVSTPGTSEITEVNVDAITGQVVSTSKESPESESKEKD
jgi:uncharacterized membrane protein YkoI